MIPPTPEPSSASFPFPSMVDLAKVAASLHPRIGADAEASINEALRLLIHAWIAREHFARRGHAEIIAELDAPELYEWVLLGLGANDVRRLYPDRARISDADKKEFFKGDLDPARSYLSEKQSYGNWSTTRTVLRYIRLLHLDYAERHNKDNAVTIKKLERAHQKMALERRTTVRQLRNGMEMAPEERRREGEEEYRSFLAKCEVTIPDQRFEGEVYALTHSPSVAYWNLPVQFLNGLVAWGCEVKAGGGFKRMEKRLIPNKKWKSG